MGEPTLFDGFEVPGTPPAAPERKRGTDAQRTIRQRQALENRLHPLSLLHGLTLRLHPDAPPVADKKADGPRCGGCQFAVKNGWGYIKCTRGRTGEIGTKSFRRGPFETHGGATDLRAWWPGCERWEARADG